MIGLAGFLAFLRNTVGIPDSAIPDDDPHIGWAYDVAVATVLCELQLAGPPIYMLAVYNLGADNLINWAPDTTGSTYFADIREKLGISAFTAGVVAASSDESTSETLVIPEFFKNLTMSDMQNLKTPYGRQYLAFAQKYGTLWGIS